MSQDANEALLRGFDMKALLASARPVPHDQIATFDDLRDEVFREVLAPELLSGTPYVAWHGARWGVACSVRRGAAHHRTTKCDHLGSYEWLPSLQAILKVWWDRSLMCRARPHAHHRVPVVVLLCRDAVGVGRAGPPAGGDVDCHGDDGRRQDDAAQSGVPRPVHPGRAHVVGQLRNQERATAPAHDDATGQPLLVRVARWWCTLVCNAPRASILTHDGGAGTRRYDCSPDELDAIADQFSTLPMCVVVPCTPVASLGARGPGV